MKVGDDYVSCYHPLNFVNMTTSTTIITTYHHHRHHHHHHHHPDHHHPHHLETLVVHPAILRYRETQGDLTIRRWEVSTNQLKKKFFLQIMKMIMRIWWWLSWLRWWWCWSSPDVIWQEWRQGQRWQWWEEEAVSNLEMKSWNLVSILLCRKLFYFGNSVDSNDKECSSVLGLILRLLDMKTTLNLEPCSMETKLNLKTWMALILCHTLFPSRGWEEWGRHLLFVLQPGNKIISQIMICQVCSHQFINFYKIEKGLSS